MCVCVRVCVCVRCVCVCALAGVCVCVHVCSVCVCVCRGQYFLLSSWDFTFMQFLLNVEMRPDRSASACFHLVRRAA